MAILPRILRTVPKGWLKPIVDQWFKANGSNVAVHWPNPQWPGYGTGMGDLGPPGEWQTRNRGQNPDMFASFSAVYTCVQTISGDVAKLPIQFYDIHKDGTR